MSELAIKVDNLSKLYKIGVKRQRYYTLRDTLVENLLIPIQYLRNSLKRGAHKAASPSHIWALDDISFEIERGEAVGIIGRNGAGKSTLLKILSRITKPTRGQAELFGRVSSMLEVGTGFNPELTGRENIYLNGAILGMRRSEIERKFDEIVDFAETEKFLDTPVKFYSSGMYVRLAFAVAAHLEPEILLVDEVLAVGDVAFQQKCLGKMGDATKDGRTILFVSHNMAAVQSLCTRGLLLDKGRLALQGDINEVVNGYIRQSQAMIDSSSLQSRSDRTGNGVMRFTEIRLMNKFGDVVTESQSGEDLIIGLNYTKNPDVNDQVVIRLAFTDSYGQRLFMCISRSSSKINLRASSSGQIRCIIPKLPLLQGRYYVSAWCKINEELADNIQDAFVVDVIPGDFYGTGKIQGDEAGHFIVDHLWEID